MTFMPPKMESNYPCRGDRLNEVPSEKNAQGMFLPSACIFVGNLSTKVPIEQLARDLKTLFERFGPCYPKIKQGKKKDLPGAFVQFECVEAANAALACEEGLVLHERPLRVERIKGKRTAILGLRSGGSISPSEVALALGGRGPLEAGCIEHQFVQPYGWTNVCKVTFVYVDDCRDAVKFFSRDDTFFMRMVDMDASPTVPGHRHSNGRGRPPTTPMPTRNGSSQGRWFDSRPQRGGPAYNRGGHHAYPRFRPPPFAHESIPQYPSPPIMGSGMPWSENNPPFYPPPPPAPARSNAGYATPPFVMDGFPGYMGAPFIPPPPAFAPPVSSGPFIVNSHPVYSPIPPPYYGGPFHQDHGFFGPHPNMNIHPGGYFPPTPTTQAYYGESYPQNPPYFTPPEIENQPTPPSTESSTVKETETQKEIKRDEPSTSHELTLPPKAQSSKVEEPKTQNPPTSHELENPPKAQDQKLEEPGTQEPPTDEVDIFNLPKSETPPRLIRVYESDSDSEDDDDDEEGTPFLRRRSNSSRSAQAPSLETVLEEREEDEAEDEATTLAPASGSDSDSARENKTRKVKRNRVMRNGPLKESSTSPSDSPSGSRGRSRSRKPLAAEYQPTTGQTVEEYVRSMNKKSGQNLSDKHLEDITRELEDERLKKALHEKFIESGSSSRSRSGSAGSTSSFKSV